MSDEMIEINGRTLAIDSLRPFPGLGGWWVIKGRRTDDDKFEPVAHCDSQAEAVDLVRRIRFAGNIRPLIIGQGNVLATVDRKDGIR